MADQVAGAENSATPGSETSASKPTGSAKVVSRGGEPVTFDDLEQVENAEAKAKRQKKEGERRRPPADSQVDESKDKERAVKPVSSDKAEKPVGKPAPKAEKGDDKGGKKAEAQAEAGDDDQDKEDGEEPLKKPKAKVHKLRHGDSDLEVAGDAVIKIPVNGKIEEHTVQDLVDEFSGKTDYGRKYGEFGVEKAKFKKEREELEGFIGEFFEKSQKDPDAAWDFLAEMKGEDPIAFKENLLRSQLQALMPIARLSEEEQGAWLEAQKLQWREKRVAAKEAADNEKKQLQRAHQVRSKIMQDFGIDEQGWHDSWEKARAANQGKFPTPLQVVINSRESMFDTAVSSAVPELVNIENYDTLKKEYIEALVKNPGWTRGQLESYLKETFPNLGGSKQTLKEASRKAVQQAEREGSSAGRRPQTKNGDVWSFDQL